MNQPVSHYCRFVLPRNAIASVVFLLLCSACGEKVGPEQELRQWLSDGQAAAEAKQRSRLVAMISSSYADVNGYQRSQISNMLSVYFLRQKTVKLLTSIDDIRVFGETAAEIDLNVGMAGSNESALGFSARAYRFELELERDGDEWLLTSARWGSLGETLN